MRILVTGMAGFIGYHCAKSLHGDGHTIMGVDNLNDYYNPALKHARLKQLASEIRFQRIDLSDLASLEQVFRDFKPEAVLHLAAQAGVRYSIDHPHAYIQSNIVGTMNILECCRHFGKPKLVYASSSSVYGGNTSLPFSESQTVDHPVSLYAATKKSNELMAHTYTHLYGIQTVGLRFFTAYGAWGRPDMALWLFADAIMANRPIKVFNFGKMQRDFTYVDDIVAGVKASLLASNLDAYEVFNLGNHRSEELEYMIGLIEQGLGKRAERILLPIQDGDVPATYADIERAQVKLGFQPTTPLAEGIPQFLEWFKAHPEFHSASQ